MEGASNLSLSSSDAQEMVLSILPIPSAILSVMGSYCIIHMVKTSEKISPYHRLLLGMSISDIIYSVTLACAAFFRPQDKSHWVWAKGNDATCSAVGWLVHAGVSATLYITMLSFYFLLSTRFRCTNEHIAKRIEPWMHFISIVYPFVCANIGAGFGYGEQANALGCWLAPYPHDCSDTGETCLHHVLGWFSFGLPQFGAAVALVVNNLVVSCFVWRHTRTSGSSSKRNTTSSKRSKISKESTKTDESESSGVDLSGDDFTVLNEPDIVSREQQSKRLRLVASQGVLFLAGYVVCTLWNGILTFIEIGTYSDQDELEMTSRYFGIYVLAAIFTPLQGLTNCSVFLRPKLLLLRNQFPNETLVWTIRRAIFGKSVKPSVLQQGSSNTERDGKDKQLGANQAPHIESEDMHEEQRRSSNKVMNHNPHAISSLTMGSLPGKSALNPIDTAGAIAEDEGRISSGLHARNPDTIISELTTKSASNFESQVEMESNHEDECVDHKLYEDLQMLRDLKKNLKADVE